MVTLGDHLGCYRTIRDQIAPPDYESYVKQFKSNQDLDDFDVASLLTEYEREGIDKSFAHEELISKCRIETKKIWDEIDKGLQACKTVSERLSLVRALLGHPDELLKGRPHRLPTMLEHLEEDSLIDLEHIGIDTASVVPVDVLASARIKCQESWDDIVKEQESIEATEALHGSGIADKTRLDNLKRSYSTYKSDLLAHRISHQGS